jgi:hypothetical protein
MEIVQDAFRKYVNREIGVPGKYGDGKAASRRA